MRAWRPRARRRPRRPPLAAFERDRCARSRFALGSTLPGAIPRLTLPSLPMTQTTSAPRGQNYLIHADGACKGNPGPGGWGALIDCPDGSRILLNGFDPKTTNNREELKGLIAALGNIPEGAAAEVVTDSKYCIQGITEWLKGWKKRGWRGSTGEPVKNQDLWVALDALSQKRALTWTWVRGHSGHAGNELADQLANEAVAARRSTRG